MNDRRTRAEIVLAIFPSAKGFGFAVFEGPRLLLDWGVKHIRGGKKNARSLTKIEELLDFYHPDVLVTEDYAGTGSRRAGRIRKLIDAIAGAAAQARVAKRCFSRAEVRACFSHRDARSKQEIAEAIAREFPELEPRLPPVRRLWMSEDARMNIFDAVALGVTFFHTKQKPKRAA